MTEFLICATYSAFANTFVTFPEGKTWDDVHDWYIKWGTLNVRFKGSDTYQEFDLMRANEVDVDWKRPDDVSVHPVKGNGAVDYDTDLA